MDKRDQGHAERMEAMISVRAPCGRIQPSLPGSRERTRDRTVISNDRGLLIEIIHRNSDPSVWIVRRWKRTLLSKRRLSSDWFIDRRQAFAFAFEMKRASEDR